MGPPDIVVNVSNRTIEWPILNMASCDRDSSFVTAENDGDEHCTVRFRVLCNDILGVCQTSTQARCNQERILHTACFHAQLPDIKCS